MKNIVFAGLCAAAIVAAGCSSPNKQATAEKSAAMENVEKASSAKAAKAAQSDVAALQGTWKGRTVRDEPQHECTFVISGKNFDFHDNTDANVWYKGTFTLKEDATPRQYIATIGDCPFPQYVGKTSMAIYKINGDTLTITANEPGNPTVPDAFDTADTACIEVKKK